MKEKSLEFKKDVYLAIFKALLTLLILDFSGVASILYKEGTKATPWVIIGSATAVSSYFNHIFNMVGKYDIFTCRTTGKG